MLEMNVDFGIVNICCRLLGMGNLKFLLFFFPRLNRKADENVYISSPI